MKRWWRFALTLVPLLALVAIIWVNAGSPDAGRDDFTEPVLTGEAPAVMTSGSGWSAEWDRETSLRLRTDDMATPWLSLNMVAGGASIGITEGRGHRIVWVIAGYSDTISVRWWSSTSVRTDHSSVPIDNSTQLVAFDLGADEQPWGLQVLDPDGVIILSQSFVT